jgi:hypothetical protein
MKHLEQLILGACYGEDNLSRVSFLVPTDFADYTHQILFQAIQKHGGMIEAIQNNHQYKNEMIGYSNLMGTAYPERLGLKLLEMRFKGLLTVLLTKLSLETKNALETNILNEAIMQIPTADIFDLSDYLIEYLGHHASDYTKNRISSFLVYRDKRIVEVKLITDELR